MNRFVWVSLFLCSQSGAGFVMPTTTAKMSGDGDVAGVASQVNLLQTYMTSLRRDMTTLNSNLVAELKSTAMNLRAVKSELAATKKEMVEMRAEMKVKETVLNSTRTRLNATFVDLLGVKRRLRALESENMSPKNDSRLGTSGTDLAKLKKELAELIVLRLNVTRSSVGAMGHDVIITVTNIEQLKDEISINRQNIDNAVVDLALNAQDQRDLRKMCTSIGVKVNKTQAELQRLGVAQHDMSTAIALKVNTTQRELLRLEVAQINMSNALNRKLIKLRNSYVLPLGKTRHVAFQVSQSKEQSTATGKSPIRFDKLVLNEGGGYSRTTGYFTAPVSGTYLFWMHMILYQDSGDCYLLKNSKTFAWGTSHVFQNSWNTASATGAIHVYKGERIAVTCRTRITSWGDSHFGGTLLHAA